MRYEHTAANTNHTALTVSPRMPAMTTQLTPPSSEMPTHRAIFAGVHLVSCDSRAASSSATGGSPGSCWRISGLSGDPYGASTLAPIITPGIREIDARARVTLPPPRRSTAQHRHSGVSAHGEDDAGLPTARVGLSVRPDEVLLPHLLPGSQPLRSDPACDLGICRGQRVVRPGVDRLDGRAAREGGGHESGTGRHGPGQLPQPRRRARRTPGTPSSARPLTGPGSSADPARLDPVPRGLAEN